MFARTVSVFNGQIIDTHDTDNFKTGNGVADLLEKSFVTNFEELGGTVTTTVNGLAAVFPTGVVKVVSFHFRR